MNDGDDDYEHMNFHIFPESKECVAKLRAFHRTGKKPPSMKFTGRFSTLEPLLRRRNSQGFGISYSVNKIGAYLAPKECVAIQAFPLDLNNAPIPDIWLAGFKPQIITEIAAGHYQVLFLTFVSDDSEFEIADGVTRRLTAFYGGDPLVCNRELTLPLPGFVNHKPGANSFLTRVVRIDNSVDEYSLSEFDTFFPRTPR